MNLLSLPLAALADTTIPEPQPEIPPHEWTPYTDAGASEFPAPVTYRLKIEPFYMESNWPFGAPNILRRLSRRSAQSVRNDPTRPKTEQDLKHWAAAQAKRDRRAAKKK